jgi:adenylate cyclase
MHVLLRGNRAQHLRLAAGLVLLSFLLTHLLNHAVGLFGIAAMNEVQTWRLAVTRTWLVTGLLLCAFFVHFALALAKLSMRSTLWLPPWELVQIVSGFAIPFLLLPHVIGAGVANRVFGAIDSYSFELAILWPDGVVRQSLLLAIAWLHACIGINYWLRLARFYRRAAPYLLAAAVTIPAFAFAGFVAAGREVAGMVASAEGFERLKAASNWPEDVAWGQLIAWNDAGTWVLIALIGMALAVPLLRKLLLLTRPTLGVVYAGGPSLRAPIGPTLLEISRMYGVPHTSVCGGRGRCTTCRVRVDEGVERLPVAGYAEAIALGSIGAAPGVRLACQLRPLSDLAVTRLVPAGRGRTWAARTVEAEAAGIERTLTVMFLDLRGFTKLSENKLPYDVVYILNQFFAVVGAAITAEGGMIDKYLGDGLMAVFGRSDPKGAGARQALAAARAIDLALDRVNAALAQEIGRELRIGIGLHAGPLVLGRIGYGETAALTVIGSTVNVASRLEALTKEKGCQLILSAEVARYAGLPADDGGLETVELRGLSQSLKITKVSKARNLDISPPSRQAGAAAAEAAAG